MPTSENEHFPTLARLSQTIAQSDLVVYEHHFSYLGFGSFTVELGRAHQRLQFKWEGKERWLTCSVTTVSSQHDSPVWSELRALELQNAQNPLAAIEVAIREHFAI